MKKITLSAKPRKLKLSKKESLYADSTIKKKSIHNAWTEPFLTYSFPINGEIETQRYQHRLAFRDIKDKLKADSFNTIKLKKFQAIQDQYEDLFYASVNSLYYLRLANRNNTVRHFDELMDYYLKRIAKIEKHFEEAVLAESAKSQTKKVETSDTKNKSASRYKYISEALQPTYYAISRSLNGAYDSSNMTFKSGLLFAEENERAIREGIRYLPSAYSKVTLQSNLMLLGASSASALTKDISNLKRKPISSALKITGGASFAAIPVVTSLMVLHWPAIVVLTSAFTLYLVGREAGRSTAHLYDYYKTGHTNPNKYLLTEERITVLEEKFHLNRLQIEDLRTHIASQMMHAKNQQKSLFGHGKLSFFKGVGHNLSDLLFSRYLHSNSQIFWRHAMQILQRSNSPRKMSKLIKLYNQTKPDYSPTIECDISLESYQKSYLA